MSLLFIDGFDYGLPMTPRYDSLTVTNAFTANGGRRGGGALDLSGTSDNVVKTLSASSTGIILGVAMKGFGSTGPFLELYEGATKHLSFEFSASPNYYIVAKRGDGTTLHTGTDANDPSDWVYFEIKVAIDNSAGTIHVVRNGTTIVSATALDTRNGGTSGALDKFKLLGTKTGSTWFDDLYVLDTTDATGEVTYLGHTVRVDTIFPKSDYADDFSPVSGTANYAMVDDGSGSLDDHDSDTTYVSSSVLNARDLYYHGALPYTPSNIYGVEVVNVARVDTAGTLELSPAVRVGTYHEGTAVAPGTTYGMHGHLWTTNPGTAEDWTRADVNSLKAGFKITAV